MRLHVIGDSHTGAFRTIGAVDISAPSQFTSPSHDEALILTSVESGIFIHYLGSMTAYKVGRDKLSAFNLNDYYVSGGSLARNNVPDKVQYYQLGGLGFMRSGCCQDHAMQIDSSILVGFNTYVLRDAIGSW